MPAESDPPAAPAVSRLEPRRLTDPRDMRAMAHPIRLALIEELGIHGSLTATQAGALIGESPSSCSFHLRTLARHGFVEETGDGRGRQRPWRLVTLGVSFDAPAAGDDEGHIAADVLGRMFIERQLGRLRAWWARRAQAPPEWTAAATHTESITWMTPAELTQLNEEVNAALLRHRARLVDPSLRPEGAELVEILYFSYPYGTGDGAAPDGPEDAAASAPEEPT